MARVSVIIPVFNGEATVAQAIDSALAQRFDGTTEIVVVNDGSTDSTRRVLENYSASVKAVHQPNRGIAAARNVGAAFSEGEYLAFLDSDDRWLPDHLSKTCAALDRNPHAALGFSDVIGVDQKGETIDLEPAGRAPSMEDLLSRGWAIFPSAVVMRRSVFERCGGFCEEFRGLGFEDTYMWLIAREQGEFEYVDEPLVIYRVTAYSIRGDKYEPGRRILMRLVRRRYGRSVDRLIQAVGAHLAPALAQKALLQMDAGDRRGALSTWLRVLRLQPSYFLNSRHFARLLRRRNVRRLLAMVLPTPTQAVSLAHLPPPQERER